MNETVAHTEKATLRLADKKTGVCEVLSRLYYENIPNNEPR